MFCIQQRRTDAVVNEVLEASATFKNPLPISLKKGQFLIEGPGLDKQLKLKLPSSVQPGDNATCTFSMTPKLDGRSTIAVKFHSKELDDVDGFLNFMVKPAKYSNNGYS